MSQMKVLIYEPYAFNTNGNLKLISLLFRMLDRQKYKLVVATPFESPLGRAIRSDGGRCVVLEPPPSLRHYGGTIFEGGGLRRLTVALDLARQTRSMVSLIRREKPDIIQCHSIRSLLMIGPAARLTKTPTIWYVKSELENAWLDRVGLALANRVEFLCDSLAEGKYPHLRRYFKQKIGLLALGVDLDEIERVENSDTVELERDLSLNRGDLNIAFLGRVSPMKGIDYLLGAMKRVQRKVKRAKLYVVGEADLEKNISFERAMRERVSSDEDLRGRVVFLGWRQDALSILSLMDFFVLPSLTEGFPRSIVEAMALGKAVIGTRVGGVPEAILENQTGLIVEPRDEKGLADAMILLAGDKALRTKLGEAGRRRASDLYSFKRFVFELEKVYRAMVPDQADYVGSRS